MPKPTPPNGTLVQCLMNPLLGTGTVVDQFPEHPEFVRVEWRDERGSRGHDLPGDVRVELKTCHVDELRVKETTQ